MKPQISQMTQILGKEFRSCRSSGVAGVAGVAGVTEWDN
jgi:hypothetical protein